MFLTTAMQANVSGDSGLQLLKVEVNAWKNIYNNTSNQMYNDVTAQTDLRILDKPAEDFLSSHCPSSK